MIPARSVKNLTSFFQSRNIVRVLDYGAGKLRNAKYLVEKGFEVYVAETCMQLGKISDLPVAKEVKEIIDIERIANYRLNVDLVICTFVLNIIDDPVDRYTLVSNAFSNLKPGGYLLLEVKERRPGQSICSSRALTAEELDALVIPVGFRNVTELRGRCSIAVLYQRW